MRWLDEYQEFCGNISIPSKDHGLIRHDRPYGTQKFLRREIAAGLEDGIHEFVALKGRQQGVTTDADALDLYWPQKHGGVVGMFVADDEPNMRFRRDVIRQMLATLPPKWRHGVRVDNDGMLAFAPNARTGFTGSRLMFGAAGKRTGGNLGRSRGINFLHADEVGSWVDERAVSGLQASLSDDYPHRLYLWMSTARGANVFKDLWETAQRVPSQRAIFIGWYLKETYRLHEDDTQLWERYCVEPPSHDELTYMKTVHERYGVKVDMAQLGWYRFQLEAKFRDDEALLAQEHPWIPEDAFQYFGDAFIEPQVVRRLRFTLESAPVPKGYRYEWAQYLDDLRVRADDESAALRVWEDCDPAGMYVVAAHPQLSSSDRAKEFVIQVWRCYPDRIIQVAEYAAGHGYMHKFGWTILHLCAAYNTRGMAGGFAPSLIMEIQGPGIAAYDEMKRIEEQGWGLRSGDDRNKLLNAVSSIMYLFRRVSSFTGTVAPHMKANQEERDRILYAMRDYLERGCVEARSSELIDQLASLRRGEEDDNDMIAGGGGNEESRAYCLALAVEQWLKLGDLTQLLAPRPNAEAAPLRVENVLVGEFIGPLLGRSA